MKLKQTRTVKFDGLEVQNFFDCTQCQEVIALSLLIIKYRPWIEKPKKSISPYKLIAILFVSNPIYHKCAKITEGD